MRPLRSTPSRWEIYNGGERFRFQAGAANQDAIDIVLCHQALHVLVLNAAPVKNADVRGRAVAVSLSHFTPDQAMCFGSDLRRRGLARADSPYRLVSDHDLRKLPLVESCDAVEALLTQHSLGPARLAML